MALIKLEEQITQIGWMMKIFEDFFDVMEKLHTDRKSKEVIYRVKGKDIPEEDKLITAVIKQNPISEDKFDINIIV